MEVSDRDLYNPNVMRDGMHDWVVANENMAKVLAEKGYQYQFVFAKNATHCDGAVKRQTLPKPSNGCGRTTLRRKRIARARQLPAPQLLQGKKSSRLPPLEGRAGEGVEPSYACTPP